MLTGHNFNFVRFLRGVVGVFSTMWPYSTPPPLPYDQLEPGMLIVRTSLHKEI